MSDENPLERQMVEVHFDDRAWLSAIYQNGEFVDLFGLPLDRQRISGWRPLDSAGKSANGRSTH